MAIANVKLRDQLRDQSIRDPLTGLFNRRYMLETCRREFSRAARGKQPVSMLSIDVDFFKKFNDNHGHDAGDTVLREVGKCLEAVFRNEDVACRFGGEEFVVVMPGAALANGAKRAEDLRAKIEALSVRYLDQNLPKITISVGAAAFPEDGDNPQSVLKAADDALYCAKESGRNRVELATSGIRPTRGKPVAVEEIGEVAAE
jgi:diguanylate cyclase (GGDEF)-like protein